MPKGEKQQVTATPAKPEVIEATGGTVVAIPTTSALVLPNAPEAALDRFRGGGQQTDNRISLPRIAVLQPMSQEVNRLEDKEPVGTFFNRLTKENYGKKFLFIPLGNYTSRIRMVQNVGLACRSIDMFTSSGGGMTYTGESTADCTVCKYKDWPTDRRARGDKTVDPQAKKPECGVSNNYPSLLINGENPEEYELILLGMASSSAGAAADLNGMQLISMSSWQNFAYELSLGQGAAPNGTPYWFQQVKRIRKSNEAERAKALNILAFLAGKQLITEAADEENVAPSGPSDPEAGAKETRF